MNGLIIRKLIFTGDGVKNSEIELKMGVNAITGGSETGKTYMFKSINFMFGKENAPAKIKERKPYSSLYMELETKDQARITIKRELVDRSKIEVYYAPFEKLNNLIPEEYSIYSSAKKSATSFYMKLLGYPNKLYFYSDKKGNTKHFTIRIFLKYFMIDEVRIIDEKLSPIFNSKQYSEHKYEIEVLKFLLTGKNYLTDGNKKKNKGRLKFDNQIELLERIIFENSTLLSEKQEEFNKIQFIDESSENIDELKEQIDELQCEISRLTDVKVELINEINRDNTRKKNIVETKTRFKLLEEQYRSELERYEFIYEGSFLMEQLPERTCPVCENEMTINDIDVEEMYKAFMVESAIINIKKNSLSDSINDLTEEIEDIEFRISQSKHKLKEIQLDIDDLTLNKLRDLKIDFDILIEKEHLASEIKSVREELERLELRKQNLLMSLGNIDEVSDEEIGTDFIENRDELCRLMSKRLEEWEFDNTVNILFDESINDFIVNDKKRSAYGKGYRAIIRVAYALTLFDYLHAKQIGSPGFMIIDSPFTTYTGRDEIVDDDVKVSDNIIKAFYNDVTKKYKNNQIIIMENDRAPENAMIHEIHFTKNNNYGRYGLFQS